ncbi:ATP-grasp domain-containing protein [Marinisporobacter balticus]|uniref:ATP-grasp domain-containing protein n=1 Tax=Marinisporobacter balticus TaxID=2018667 RepID=A0A4R2KH93_9FIRM|nr:ATP-grasp domain-containing protein [Marinisporobacter balticus]TCO69358.1 ATP-grasp domain-containing protein [Marinisporobacter balticus]
MSIKNVLITGARAPVALDLARKFAKRGINIYTADSTRYNLCMKSKAVIKNFILPKPNVEYEAFIVALRDIIKKYHIDLIIPTCEEIFYVAKGLGQRHCKVFCSDIDLLSELHNKYDFIRLCQQQNIIIPKTKIYYCYDEILEYIKSFPFQTPLVLKPVYSRFGANVHILSEDKSEIPKIEISESYPWILQEYIEGTQFCTYSIVQNGKIVSHCHYENKFTINNGANIYFQHIDNKEIYCIIEKLVANLNFTGQIAFDMIQTKEGVIFPIECNPRATSGIHLFDENVTKAFVDTNSFIRPIEKSKMLVLPMIIYGIKSKDIFSKNWWTTFLKSEDVIFNLRDLSPFFYQFFVYLSFFMESLKNHKKIEAIATEDIEWNGEF